MLLTMKEEREIESDKECLFGSSGKDSRLGQIWVKHGFRVGFAPNRRWIYLGHVGGLFDKNNRFQNFYIPKTAVFTGRSIGIRTRGLLDPKSPQC